jgi:hypothetical protein
MENKIKYNDGYYKGECGCVCYMTLAGEDAEHRQLYHWKDIVVCDCHSIQEECTHHYGPDQYTGCVMITKTEAAILKLGIN